MTEAALVYVVDDNDAVRQSMAILFETVGLAVKTFAAAEHFLQAYQPGIPGCLILDVCLPGMTGPELQAEMARRGIDLPIIFLTGHGSIPLTVKAIQAGAADFLTKPVDGQILLQRVQAAVRSCLDRLERKSMNRALQQRFATLTGREREVLALVLEGHSNKEIARRLGISFRTVEHHRSNLMLKAGAGNLLELARMLEACD
jgi:FixJ family two-component response regulator